MKKEVDYLIVGQGLAGTFLGFQLMQKGFSVMFVDKGHKYSSSFVAAGVINPIVLRRYTVTWRAKEFLQYNANFYAELDAFLGKQYHFEMPIEKIISSVDEENFWQHRFSQDDVKDFIYKDLQSVNEKIAPTKKFKVGLVKQTSWLNISELLQDFRKYLIEEDLILEEEFNFKEIQSNDYKSVNFKKIVFCEGANGKYNPYFGYLPFSLNKGQLITIKNNQLPNNTMLKKKVFILPTKKNEFKIGATYSWKWDTSSEEKAHQLEPEKTAQLQEFLEEITTSDYKVIKEETGIRPSIKDRRPVIGKHPDKRNFYIFNGMGTRGCFMAPLLCKEFVDYSEENIPLNEEVRLNRFKD